MKPLSRFLIVSGSICCLLMPKKIARACGWYVSPGEYRFWILQPDLANVADLSPFFLSSGYTYLDNWQKTPDEPYEVNVNEWYEAIDHAALKRDIHEVLYQFSPNDYFLRLESPEPKNSFIQYLQQPANRELLTYMRLCKLTEAMASDPDPWEERPAHDPKIARLLHLADSIYRNGKSEFVRLRTAYQMLRLHRYDRNSEAVLKTYDSLVAPENTGSYIKTAALYEKAKYVAWPERDYLYARIFSQGYRRKYCVAFMKSDSLDAVLPLAHTTSERSALRAMAILNRHDRCLPLIKLIYANDPAYEDLGFLLLREINKTEDWLVTNKVTDYEPALSYQFYGEKNNNYIQDLQYAKQLYQFIAGVIQEGKNGEPTLFHLFASHLAMILKDYDASHQHLAAVKQQVNLPENIQLQVQVNDVLLHVLTGQFDQQIEKQLLQILNTPDSLLPVQSAYILKDQLTLFIGKKLLAGGEKIKGLLLLGRTRRSFGDLDNVGAYKNVYHLLEESAGPEDYDSLLSILDKKNKTAFEKFGTDSPLASPSSYYEWYENAEQNRGWDKNKLLDLKASWYIRHDRLPEALVIIEKLPDSTWSTYPHDYYVNSDPFTVSVYKGHQNDLYEPVCNKPEIIKEMIRLQRLATEKPALAALCYLHLGNAHYNLSWHGKNWLLVKQWWSMYEFEHPEKITAFNDNYFGCAKANEYYLKAAKLATDKKLASFAYFMSAKCTAHFREYRANVANLEIKGNFGNRQAALLKQRGFDTDFYNDLVNECDTYDRCRREVRSLLP